MNPEALQMLMALQGGGGDPSQGMPNQQMGQAMPQPMGGAGMGGPMPMMNPQNQQNSMGNDYMSVLNSAPPMTPPPQGIF